VSAGLTAASGLYGGVTQYEAGQERSRLFNANADIASRQAISEEAAGAFNESMVRMRGKQVEGQQVASIGANNLTQGGTNAQVVASTAAVNELDALTTRNNALRKAWGFRVQQASDEQQAGFAKSAGIGSAVGSILTGGAKGYSESNAAGSWF
jgi:hypothetical protein